MKPIFILLRNTVYQLLTEVAKPFISFFLVVYISRRLGADGIGTYSTVIIFFFIFETIATLGLGNILTRDIAVAPKKIRSYYTAALVIGLATALLTTGLLYVFLFMLQYPAAVAENIRTLSFSLIFLIVTMHAQSIFEGLQRMEYKSAVSLTETFGRALIGIAAIYFGYGITGVIWGIVAVRILTCSLAVFILARLGYRPSLGIDWSLCLQLAKKSSTFLLITLVSTTYWHLDVLMISKLRGVTEVGAYTIAYRLMDILKGLSIGFIVALYPMLSASFHESSAAFRNQCRQAVKYLFLMTFPIAVGTSILADRIILLIYGSSFAASGPSLRVLIWTICLFPSALIFARALVASHNQRLDLTANLLALFFNVLLNVLLIGRYGYFGAAVATLVSIAIFLVLQYLFVAGRLFKPALFELVWKPIFAGSLMGLFVFSIQNLNLLLIVAAGAGVYVTALLAVRAFSDREYAVMRELWHHRLELLVNRRKPV